MSITHGEERLIFTSKLDTDRQGGIKLIFQMLCQGLWLVQSVAELDTQCTQGKQVFLEVGPLNTFFLGGDKKWQGKQWRRNDVGMVEREA